MRVASSWSLTSEAHKRAFLLPRVHAVSFASALKSLLSHASRTPPWRCPSTLESVSSPGMNAAS